MAGTAYKLRRAPQPPPQPKTRGLKVEEPAGRPRRAAAKATEARNKALADEAVARPGASRGSRPPRRRSAPGSTRKTHALVFGPALQLSSALFPVGRCNACVACAQALTARPSPTHVALAA